MQLELTGQSQDCGAKALETCTAHRPGQPGGIGDPCLADRKQRIGSQGIDMAGKRKIKSGGEDWPEAYRHTH